MIEDDFEASFQVLSEKYKNEVLHLIDPKLKKVLHGGLRGNKYELILPSENNVYLDTKYFKPQGATLLHFTNIRSLYSIISEAAIRAYDLNNSNDPKELTYAMEKFSDSNFEKYEAPKKRTLITSFCNPDALSNLIMWRLYGHDGRGVAIIFSVHNDPIKWNGYHLGSVQYNPFIKFMKAHKRFIDGHPEVIVDISKLLAFHKSPHFEIENEIRLIYNKHKYNTQHNLFSSDVNRFNQPVNYMKINIFNDQQNILIQNNLINETPVLKIEKIIVGFQLKNQFSSIKDHLESYIGKVLGYYIKIELSTLGDIFH